MDIVQQPAGGSNTAGASECAKQYCARLAGILLSSKEMFKSFEQALTGKELRIERQYARGLENLLDQNNIQLSAQVLSQLLQDSPRLQSMAASSTNYTPSVWLLEQELRARGKGDEICRRTQQEQVSTVEGREEAGQSEGARESNADTPPRAACDHPEDGGPCVASVYDVYEVARRCNATGMCLSGGGIRSATFNLGVLQGLAQLNLLSRFDYLSSVSGGGYIHQFLAAWLKNSSSAADPKDPSGLPRDAMAYVQDKLTPLPQERTPNTSNVTEQPGPIRWLRRYSNYLTPRTGMFSTDTWVMVAVWVRNTFLNQIVLIATLAAMLSIPHLFTRTDPIWEYLRSAYVHELQLPWSLQFSYVFPSLAILAAGCATSWLVAALLRESMRASGEKSGSTPEAANPASQDQSKINSGAGKATEPPSTNDQAGPVEASPKRRRIRTWHGAAWLLLAISILASPAVYRSVFTTPMTAPSASNQANPAKSPAQEIAGCQSPNCALSKAGFATKLPASAGDCPYCASSGQPMRELNAWRAHYMYPVWLGWNEPGFPVAVSFLAFLALFSFFSAINSVCIEPNHGKKDVIRAYVYAIVAAALSVVSGWAVLHGIRVGLFTLYFFVPLRLFAPIAIVLLPCMLMATIFMASMVTAGIMGNLTDDPLREDLARLRALAMCATLLWLAFTGASLLGPSAVQSLSQLPYVKHILSLSWIGTTVASVFAGKSSNTSSSSADPSSKLNALVLGGPPIFVVGLFLFIATGVQWLISSNCQDTNFLFVLGLIAAFGAVAILFGFRLDINDFSMHAFYRDRIARCYAGASFPKRRPDRFTGFARTDSDIRVADLLPKTFGKAVSGDGSKTPQGSYAGPFPIFCATVNLTFGQDLAWQERKGASFCFSPLYSGYSVGWTSEHLLRGQPEYTYNGFAQTKSYAYDGGIHMHSAVAISGAAVSPNWGYHTNPAMAFLLTMFNVRLGWWIKNPRLAIESWRSRSGSPPFPLYNLLNELMGRATDTQPYVYLTDGGHFDNMGLYELVRRRCRRIVVCDAEQDGKNTFEGIGMAIRKARVDFGAEISLDLRDLDPRILDPSVVPPASVAPRHFVTGTIRYPEDSENQFGQIIYIKASITGNEPGDVLNYKREHDEFPHESTADQWFTESQFESYRRLGYHAVLGDEPKTEPLRDVLRAMFPA